MTPKPPVAEGAARAFTELQLGGPCVENETNPATSASVGIAVDGNGDRVGLLIVNLGVNPVIIALSSGVSSTFGILLSASGGLATFNVRDDYTLPTRRWYSISPAGASTLYVLEINRVKLGDVV